MVIEQLGYKSHHQVGAMPPDALAASWRKLNSTDLMSRMEIFAAWLLFWPETALRDDHLCVTKSVSDLLERRMFVGVRHAFPAAGLAALVAGSASAGQVFSDLAAFQAAVPNAVLNDFNTVPDGFTGSLSFNFGAFAYEIRSTGLFNSGGTVSTVQGGRVLQISFTSGDVRAFAGDWWTTDVGFSPVASQITITLDGGITETFNTNDPTFIGYKSSSSITSISIATDVSNGFVTMDNFRVAVVPLPPAAWAGLGLLGVIGGVRAVRRRG